MTLGSAVPTFRDGVPGGETVNVATDEDVTRWVELPAQPWANAGSIQTGEAGYLVTDGELDSPAAPSETGFPAGSGLPVERITEAVREFVRTRRVPGAVSWREPGT